MTRRRLAKLPTTSGATLKKSESLARSSNAMGLSSGRKTPVRPGMCITRLIDYYSERVAPYVSNAALFSTETRVNLTLLLRYESAKVLIFWSSKALVVLRDKPYSERPMPSLGIVRHDSVNRFSKVTAPF